jgi:SAM-dependent methyltransferase
MPRATRPDHLAQRVDYDRIAPSYDQRFDGARSNGVLAALQALAEDLEARRVLEVGCVNAIHHFGDSRAFVSEAHRLLTSAGILAVIGSDPHDGRSNWYVYDYFRGTLETDLQRFPSWGTVLDWMVTEGFEEVEWRMVKRIHDHKVGRDVLADPFLQKNACSQLALLSDEAYAAGLRRIESALEAAAAADETVTFPVDLRLGALIGRSPGNEDRTRTR